MRTFLMLAIVLITAFSSTNAAVPQLINYQGVLTDSAGSGLDTTVSIVFTIYDDPSTGVSVWTETQPVVTVSAGLFNVLLGSVAPILDTVFNGTTRYLGIAIAGDPEISPRTALVSVPYAQRVSTVDGATGGIISGDVSIQSDLTVSGKATIGPGNTNMGTNAFVAGSNNVALGIYSVVSGGGGAPADANSAPGKYSAIGGGLRNTASGFAAIVGGGFGNTASGIEAIVGGGRNNTASGDFSSTVSGGSANTASAEKATVSGGQNNTASDFLATVGGGFTNTASNLYATVGGGSENTASGRWATVSGGDNNIASDDYATVSGGQFNTASGPLAVAIGSVAKAKHSGSIVIAANSSGNAADSIASGGNEQLVIRADGGLYLTNTSEAAAPYDPLKIITTRGGAYLSGNGTTWTNASDKNQKENFTDIDSEALLEKISELPISRWNYKDEDETVTHIGPVAQDFYALFGVGADDISISTIDPAGIALAAIKELIEKNNYLEQDNKELNNRLEKLEK
ncbi:MAG: tail fiber domain-containing protein, partial [candidate division Zixibacteria bacterium]|nr:tail fiber domain-containing protein [candidate division Zixibacteria bacterium]